VNEVAALFKDGCLKNKNLKKKNHLMYWRSLVLAWESTHWKKVAVLWNSCLTVGESISFSCGFIVFKKKHLEI